MCKGGARVLPGCQCALVVLSQAFPHPVLLGWRTVLPAALCVFLLQAHADLMCAEAVVLLLLLLPVTHLLLLLLQLLDSDPDLPWYCCLHPEPHLASCLVPEEPHDMMPGQTGRYTHKTEHSTAQHGMPAHSSRQGLQSPFRGLILCVPVHALRRFAL